MEGYLRIHPTAQEFWGFSLAVWWEGAGAGELLAACGRVFCPFMEQIPAIPQTDHPGSVLSVFLPASGLV